MTFEESVQRFEHTYGTFTLGDHGNDLNAQGNAIIEAIADEGYSDEEIAESVSRFKSKVEAWLEMLEQWKDHLGRK